MAQNTFRQYIKFEFTFYLSIPVYKIPHVQFDVFLN
jgi:hypothetical protein